MSIETYGNYQLIKRLAMGGMAQIYLARPRSPGGAEKLVVKRILPHLAENADFIRMFLDEARIAARLNHPNIVQIHDLGAQDDSFFIAMEYIHGEDLRRVWKRADRAGTPIPVPLVCRVIIDACAGLDYAHKKTDAQGKPLGIVHRDISPQNILLTFDGRVKVVDFGIAKAADQATVTRSGVLKGKYSYMSPEQAAGQKVDCRSDIFALGVVLYELLTCIRLFKRPNDMATLQAVADCNILPPSQANPRVPKDLDALVMKALARGPDDRFAEAAQLQLALEDWLASHPLPSSTADVAAFMQTLYATRLAEEARLGDVLVEDSESLPPQDARSLERAVDRSAETRAAPARDSTDRQERPSRSRTPRGDPRGSSERKVLEPRRTVDLRRAAELPAEPRSASSDRPRPSRAKQPALPASVPAPAPIPAPTPRRQNRLAVGLVTAGVLVGLGLGAWGALRSGSAPLAPDATAKVAPRPKPPEPSPSTTSTTSEPPREQPKPSPVRLTLRTKPEQVSLTVDGKAYEKTPVVVSATPGQELTVRAEAARYRAVSRKIAVGQGPAQDVILELEPLAEPVHRDERKPEPARAVVTETRETRPQEGRKAMVRFVVKPLSVWAEVSCNGTKMGETPFRDVQMTVGSYDCKFSNPDQGTRTRRVEVKPGVPNIVVVQF
ncbi:MAG TPA: serine/threonine-protein kinase [Archangium sp.]|uniref:serine/threonine-protein kinase n=1 Tax=Archangium sp. TaxID=1872627 RepID=UPI002EDB07DD